MDRDSRTQEDFFPEFSQQLSERQQAILRQLERGRTDHEIARELGLVEAVLKRNLIRLFQELGMANRSQVVDWARQQGR